MPLRLAGTARSNANDGRPIRTAGGDPEVVIGNCGAPGAILTNNGDGVPDIVAGRSDAPNTLYLGPAR